MNNDRVGSIDVIMIIASIVFGACFTYQVGIKGYIMLPEKAWKCTNADIINDDPSKTDCTVYKKIKEN